MGKSSRNKKWAIENLNFFYHEIGTSSSAGGHLTQEEAAKEAIAIRMIWKDKVKLDGKIVKEEEETVKRIKGEALKEKEDPRAFIFPLRLEGQVGVTTLIAKFLILDIPIDRDSPIVVGRGFLCTIGAIVNTLERIFSTFDGFCHQTFRAARSDFMRNAESDSDDEEDYQIKRNMFGAPIYGPKTAPYLNCNDPDERSLAIQTTMGTNDNEAGSSQSKRSRHETVEEVLLPQVHHEFFLWEGCNTDAKSRMGCDGEIDDMLRIRVREVESDEEIFILVAWIRAFKINEPIYPELCHEFYSTYEFNEVCADDELQTKKIIKFRLGGCAYSLTLLEFARRLGLYQAVELEEDGFNVYFEGAWVIARWMKRKGAGTQRESQICCGQFISKLARKCRVLTEDVVRSLNPHQGVPRVGIPRPPRASMQDLYDRIDRMEIRQEVIEPMEYRQSYHWDRYQGVFEHMAGVYSAPMQRAYNPPGKKKKKKKDAKQK
ncbi:hypothetical protein Tco_1304398 [Tanacetum coccineum]